MGRRLILNPDPRNGEEARNSARLPLRSALRSHSSAATTTAVVRPCLVIFCGPCDFALSRSSLNFAFASATVQVWVLMRIIPNCVLYYGHNSHFIGSRQGEWRSFQFARFPRLSPAPDLLVGRFSALRAVRRGGFAVYKPQRDSYSRRPHAKS